MSTEYLDLEISYQDESIPNEDQQLVQDTHPGSPIHYNLRTLSYSSTLTLHSCPRKFELSRLLQRSGDDDEAGHLIFGTVVGNGMQEYLITGDLDKAIFRAFLDWNDNLESDRGIKSNKTFWHAVYALQQFVRLRHTQLSQYDLVWFDGKPACELGFTVVLPGGFKYRGKLDALLIHRTKKEYLVMECKTTGLSSVNEAMYMNSNQALGYGLVIDGLVAAGEDKQVVNSYDVLYPVYKTKYYEWEEFKFRKSNTSRALWLQSLLLDTKHIEDYAALGFFPTHGESCTSFGRPCPHFGMCHMDNSLIVPNKPNIKLDRVDEFPLTFSLEELILAQMEKVE